MRIVKIYGFFFFFLFGYQTHVWAGAGHPGAGQLAENEEFVTDSIDNDEKVLDIKIAQNNFYVNFLPSFYMRPEIGFERYNKDLNRSFRVAASFSQPQWTEPSDWGNHIGGELQFKKNLLGLEVKSLSNNNFNYYVIQGLYVAPYLRFHYLQENTVVTVNLQDVSFSRFAEINSIALHPGMMLGYTRYFENSRNFYLDFFIGFGYRFFVLENGLDEIPSPDTTLNSQRIISNFYTGLVPRLGLNIGFLSF